MKLFVFLGTILLLSGLCFGKGRRVTKEDIAEAKCKVVQQRDYRDYARDYLKAKASPNLDNYMSVYADEIYADSMCVMTLIYLRENQRVLHFFKHKKVDHKF